MKDSKKGFTLVEVLVFVTIISIFFITALTVTVASLRNMQINEHKIHASKYADELLEWLRSEKESDWKTFLTKSIGLYCFNNLSWPAGTGSCGTATITGTPFTRQATLSQISGGNIINIKITITWNELGNTYSVPLETVISVWE